MTEKLNVVVTSATGAQGRAIAEGFAAAGHAVTGLTRRATDDAAPFRWRTAEIDANALAGAFAGADVVVLTSPIDHRPGAREALAEAVVKGAERAGVSRIVFNAAAAVFEDYDRPVSVDLRRVRDIVLSGPVPAVALQPTVYFDNLRQPWAAASIREAGVLAYPMPPDAPVSWISHKSLADFAVAAATGPGLAGRVFDIGGPVAITGPELTDIVGRHVGRPVRYEWTRADDFAVALNQVFGPPVGDDIADLYRVMETDRTVMRRDPVGWADLKVVPETAEAWAARPMW